MHPMSHKIDRFQLAAILDRLIYGSETSFDPADAKALLEFVPPVSFRDMLPGIRIVGSYSSGGAQGYAAGVGNVRAGQERRSFDLDSEGRKTVRAGQWKLRRGAGKLAAWFGTTVVEIEQVMAGDITAGRCAQVIYRNGQPVRMLLQKPRALALGPVLLVLASFVPWKLPASG
jgi:hypothetical protein